MASLSGRCISITFRSSSGTGVGQVSGPPDVQSIHFRPKGVTALQWPLSHAGAVQLPVALRRLLTVGDRIFATTGNDSTGVHGTCRAFISQAPPWERTCRAFISVPRVSLPCSSPYRTGARFNSPWRWGGRLQSSTVSVAIRLPHASLVAGDFFAIWAKSQNFGTAGRGATRGSRDGERRAAFAVERDYTFD